MTVAIPIRLGDGGDDPIDDDHDAEGVRSGCAENTVHVEWKKVAIALDGFKLPGIADRDLHIRRSSQRRLADRRAQQVAGIRRGVKPGMISSAKSAFLSLEACGAIGRQISENTWRSVGAIAQEERTALPVIGCQSANARPGEVMTSAPSTSRIVGKMSTVSTIRSTTSPRSLAGQFDQERHLKDVGEIVLRRPWLASVAAFAVTRTVIGCDDDESLVV